MKNDEDMAVRKSMFLKFNNVDVGIGCSKDPLFGYVMNQSVKFELENSSHQVGAIIRGLSWK